MQRFAITALVITFVIAAGQGATLASKDWTRFRGPDGSGAIDGPPVPNEWSATENLKWRTALPGKGVSSPVVTRDRVYVMAYTGYGIDPESPGDMQDLVRHLLAFDRKTGNEVWRKSVQGTDDEDPFEGFITQHGYASSTPVSDGKNVYAIFGKSGLYAFDKKGAQLWHVDLGRKSDPARWGDSSSPILVDGVIVVNAGILGNKIVGLDKRTGEALWSHEDAGFTSSWSTPAEIRVGDKTLVLVQVPKTMMGIDPANGEVVWTATSPLDDATTGSIVTKGENAYIVGSRAGAAMGVKCDGSGDVSESHVLWSTRVRSGITTPLAVGDAMYWQTGGIFIAADLTNGEVVYKERLPRKGGATGGFPNADYSSAIAVGDKIIQFTRNGESYVIEPGKAFNLVAHNAPFEGDDTSFSATPAASRGELFVRSDGYLYCIAEN